MLENIINSLKKTGKKARKAAASSLVALLLSVLPVNNARADTHYVSKTGLHIAPYTESINAATNIQAAIDVAGSNDVINVSEGKYNEQLSLNDKFVDIVGDNPTNTYIHNASQPIITINGGDVKFSNLSVAGGNWIISPPWEYFSPRVTKGIVSTNNANVSLENMNLENVYNFYYTQYGGNLSANNVSFETRKDTVSACDIGFELKGVNSADLSGIRQEKGNIDHTINVNNYSGMPHTDINVSDSTIRAKNSTYGDCIRFGNNVSGNVSGCYLYRDSTTTVPYPGLNHTGVAITGPSNNVTITGNIIDSLPTGIYAPGSLFDSNKIKVENNQIKNSLLRGVGIAYMDYDAIDLGGGRFGSEGNNTFSHTNAPAGYYDVEFLKDGKVSTANIYGIDNHFSNTNKEDVIYDKKDDNSLGRLITERIDINSTTLNNGKPCFSWNDRGAGETYAVYSTSDLKGEWSPIATGITTNSWTDSSNTNSTVFYRVRAEE